MNTIPDSSYQKGIVEVDGRVFKVIYKFIDEDTIRCTTKHGDTFFTHYKSLVIGEVSKYE